VSKAFAGICVGIATHTLTQINASTSVRDQSGGEDGQSAAARVMENGG